MNDPVSRRQPPATYAKAYASFSHDMRDNLCNAHMYIQLLEIAPEQLLEFVQVLKNLNLQAINLIDDMDDYGKTTKRVHVKRFDGVYALEQVVDAAKQFSQRKNVRITLSYEKCGEQLPVFVTDKAIFERVMLNVLSFAQRHMGEEGIVNVQARFSQALCTVTVFVPEWTDTRAALYSLMAEQGVSEEGLRYVPSRYAGLFMASSLISRIHGTIDVDTTGRGSSVILTFPSDWKEEDIEDDNSEQVTLTDM